MASSKADKAAARRRVENEVDFVESPRHGYSLRKLLADLDLAGMEAQKQVRLAARSLVASEQEIEETRDEALERLREEVPARSR